MLSAFSQLAGAPVANLMVIAALVCIAIAIFGWAKETIAATTGFRTASGLMGVLLLFGVYGIYLPHAARNGVSNDPEDGRPTKTRSAPTQQVVARQTQSLAQQPVPSAQPAQSAQSAAPSSPSPTQEQQQQQSPPPAPQAPVQNLFSGRWKNADPKAASILFLKVEERGDEITVRAWGLCGSQYCDWGTGHGVVRDGEAMVIWKQGAVLRRMKLQPEGGSLRVVLDSTSRGRPQHIEAHFGKSL